MLRNKHVGIICVSHLSNGAHLVDLSKVKCGILNFKLILQVLYIILGRSGQGVYCGCNMEVCTIPTIPRFHIYKSSSSYVLIGCSHVPIYTFLCEQTTFMCSKINVLTFPQACNMFMCAINLFPCAQYRHLSQFGTPKSLEMFNIVYLAHEGSTILVVHM